MLDNHRLEIDTTELLLINQNNNT